MDLFVHILSSREVKMVKFCPIASGSNGNCSYIATESTQILIDAGLSGKAIEQNLKSINIPKMSLDGIFITHEHSDHIQGVGILSRRYNIPIYATPGTWTYIERHNILGRLLPENKRVVYKNQTCSINDITLQPFEISHDATEPVGYTVFAEGCKISVATDIGCVTDSIKDNLLNSDILLIESNHDIEMLVNSKYPKYLKDRVISKHGHLSNVDAGRLLREIMNKKLKHVFLGHLSEKNNTPLIAMDAVTRILEASGIETNGRLHIAHRGAVSKLVQLD